MSGERLDYGIERQRHNGFGGRKAVLAALDRLLLDDSIPRAGIERRRYEGLIGRQVVLADARRAGSGRPDLAAHAHVIPVSNAAIGHPKQG